LENQSLAIPVVAIVGRPNVGKSSLFNALAGRRIAIVDPTAGVTRDRVATLVSAGGRDFELVDTGGMGIEDVDNLTAEIEQQIETAIQQAHVILFVLDARSGLAPLDERVARRLRGVTKPIIFVANKCDTPELDSQAAEFHRLGKGRLICVSAHQKRGKQELLDVILLSLPAPESIAPTPEVTMKLAIVGRRNTGKSTFINSLAKSERMIVSEVPGTTRDSVDVRFERDGKVFIAIDTAGVRRRKSIGSNVEFYSLARAERSIRRADVVLLFLDAAARISKVDKRLAEYVLQQHKPAIFAVNKWDLLAPMPTSKFGDYLRKVFPSLDYVPIAFLTAKEGKNVYTVLNLAQNLFKQASARVTTGDLNRVLRHALGRQAPPMRQNRRPKIQYATQVATLPPTIVLFTNGPGLFDETYERFLIKMFRDNLPFRDVPIKLYLRHKHRDERTPVEEAFEPAAPSQPKPTKLQRVRSKPAAPGAGAGKKTKKGLGRPEAGVWKDL
jgi:GTP-binding protein